MIGYLMVGTNDLAKETGALPTSDRIAFTASLSLTLMAARAYGLAAIDGVRERFSSLSDRALIRLSGAIEDELALKKIDQ